MNETILVLEDSETNRNIMAAILQKLGYSVLTGENGNDGFKCLEKCETENLNLVAVISDLMMPVVDGPTFVTRLREDAKYQNTPVIFMTAATDKSHLILAKKLKVAGYLLKPVNLYQLTAKLKEIFPLKSFGVFEAKKTGS